MHDLILTPLRTVQHLQGNIYHAIKASDPGFKDFGEAYFSTINHGAIKGWKRHNRISLNIVVPIGAIKFVIFDDRESTAENKFHEVYLGFNYQYSRLTLPPKVWVAFQGLSTFNMLMNIIPEEHDPDESDNIPLRDISYTWQPS